MWRDYFKDSVKCKYTRDWYVDVYEVGQSGRREGNRVWMDDDGNGKGGANGGRKDIDGGGIINNRSGLGGLSGDNQAGATGNGVTKDRNIVGNSKFNSNDNEKEIAKSGSLYGDSNNKDDNGMIGINGDKNKAMADNSEDMNNNHLLNPKKIDFDQIQKGTHPQKENNSFKLEEVRKANKDTGLPEMPANSNLHTTSTQPHLDIHRIIRNLVEYIESISSETRGVSSSIQDLLDSSIHLVSPLLHAELSRRTNHLRSICTNIDNNMNEIRESMKYVYDRYSQLFDRCAKIDLVEDGDIWRVIDMYEEKIFDMERDFIRDGEKVGRRQFDPFDRLDVHEKMIEIMGGMRREVQVEKRKNATGLRKEWDHQRNTRIRKAVEFVHTNVLNKLKRSVKEGMKKDEIIKKMSDVITKNLCPPPVG